MPGHLLQVEGVTARIQTVRNELPAAADGAVPGLPEKLTASADFLRAAQDDIQLHVLPPISADHAGAIEDLVRSVIELLKMDVVRSKLARPVTGDDLITEGVKLLGEASTYKYLAGYFFSDAVVQARVAKAFEEVEKDVNLLAGRASNFKDSVLKFLEKIVKAFSGG